ncbi:MAG TPA: HAMP domain-containing sensor histidine kinase [Gaiellaceae bacterium]|nr:HAMP domain-containing sensor histidine kinase [Gaiellaceae bacterium]
MTRPDDLEAHRLAVLVHEVRSPVAALSTIAGAVRADDAGLPTLVELATAACRTIERLVRDAAAASVELEDVDPGALVREVAATAGLRGARMRATVQAGLPQLRADPLRLRQALDNLVSNALVHAPRGDEVVVAAALDDGHVLLSVSDRGDGIPPREQSRIFERGVRLDDTRPGSGLGLAIAKAIAEAHGGTLSVESEPGRGSTFTIALPVS